MWKIEYENVYIRTMKMIWKHQGVVRSGRIVIEEDA